MAKPRLEIAMARCAGSALLAAIEIYNKPTVEYREQTFAMLATNAWEVLLKARLVQLGQGKIQTIYRRKSGSRRYVRDKTTNEPITISMSQAIDRVGLSREAKANIQGIIETRNKAAHLGMLKPEVRERILRFGTAAVQNFIKLSFKWFGETVDMPYLLPVGFVGHATGTRGNLPKGQKALINTLDNLTRLPSDTKDPEYSVVMDVQIDIQPGLSGGGSVGMTNNSNAPKFRVSDDEALATFSATYHDLIRACKKRYSDFKQNTHFYRLLKLVKADPNCAHERKLNPNSSKSSKQMFYNLDAVLVRLDIAYTRTN